MKEAYEGAKSYKSIHKWPRQQHFISNAHRELWTKYMINITQQGSRQLQQPLGAWTTAPIAVRPYRMAGDKLLLQQQDESWLQHDQHIHQPQTSSIRIQFNELGGQQIELPREHRHSQHSASRNLNTTIYRRSRHHRVSMRKHEIIRPRIQQYTFAAFVTFVNANMHICSICDIRQCEYAPSGTTLII